MMAENSLVIVIGQVRSATLTGDGWRRHFLDVLGQSGNVAVALCRCAGYAEPDPFFEKRADFVWELAAPERLNDVFDAEAARLGAAIPSTWACLRDITGNWLSEIWDDNGKRPGAAARCLLLRHHALQQIHKLGLVNQFQRVIVTRSDLYYIADHPPLTALPPGNVWIQRGQDYGGIPDRHNIVAMRDVHCVLDVLSPLLLRPNELRQLMRQGTMSWNIESYMKLMLIWHRQYHALRRFPNTMFLVRSDQAESTWAEGVFDEALGFRVKYPDEKRHAEINAALLREHAYDPRIVQRQTVRERADTAVHALPPFVFPLTRRIRNRWDRFVRGV